MELYLCPRPLESALHTRLRALGVQPTTDPLDDWDLCVPGYGPELDDQLDDLLPHRIDQWVAGLPRIYHLSNKGNLWDQLQRAFGREAAAAWAPESWLLDGPDGEARLRALWPRGPLILKDPLIPRRGGVLLGASLEEAVAAWRQGFIIAQRLWTEQRLVRGRRLHLRAYLLLVAEADHLSAWLHREGRVIYAPLRADEGDVVDAWITRSTSRAALPDPALPYTWADAGDEDTLPRAAVARTLRRAMEAVAAPLLAARRHTPNPALQLFGADLLFTPSGEAVLLEVNKGPEMRPRGPRDALLKRAVLDDTLAVLGLPTGGRWPGGFSLIWEGRG